MASLNGISGVNEEGLRRAGRVEVWGLGDVVDWISVFRFAVDPFQRTDAFGSPARIDGGRIASTISRGSTVRTTDCERIRLILNLQFPARR
ncbi:MAG TPA: hypothetical protein PKZ07_12570 [Sedimentisphaerales bacterium]|nr:hypothetical protein [Sedimentisphaerales bacterium]